MINEVFFSIQGESTWAGSPCVFVRLTGCHLRCGYCDTEYAFGEGTRRSVDDVIEEVRRIGGDCRLVEITGGEPLLQPNVHELMGQLCDAGYTVLLETGGACDITACDDRVIRIMDLKTPGSGEEGRNRRENLELLNQRDEVKFVITDRSDYEWSRDVVRKHDLPLQVNAVLFSPVHDVPPGRELPGCAGLSGRELAEWVLTDGLDVRVQVQMHKLIWDPTTRGV